MFKFLLATRYLRTRYIALASIISVMLGVATMIVVNSVMAGFREEMYKRLHGILSDVVVESHGLEGIDNAAAITTRVRQVVGDELAGLTTTVQVPGVLSFQIGEEWITRQINLIGIDDATYAGVSDFSQFLLHPSNREQLSFGLQEDGYDERLQGNAGWGWRRLRVRSQRIYEQEMKRLQQRMSAQSGGAPTGGAPIAEPDPNVALVRHDVADKHPFDQLVPGHSSSSCPHCGGSLAESTSPLAQMTDPTIDQAQEEGHTFDEMTEQHPGIVLGIAISSQKRRDADGNVLEYFLCRPGDDVQITFPSAGTPPTAVHSTFTVVDFYESKMSEYDSTIAFCPLSELQELRGMIDRERGEAAVDLNSTEATGRIESRRSSRPFARRVPRRDVPLSH